ncbi:hypothetical protein MMC17_007378 [Xylographa soralifera]|nr:hypothetical protein [Xylographa soralifera]
MYGAMKLQFVSIFLFFIVPPSFAQAPGLFDALRISGASQFADTIESDPVASALYLSPQVQTVFAPVDDTVAAYVKRQETPAQEQQAGYQASAASNYIANINRMPGAPITTKNTNANLGGKAQSVVSDSRTTSSSNSTRKGISLLRRQSLNATLPSLLNIFSGLGNNVSIIKADIPYDGGVIQIVDGYFTLPQTLSATTAATGHNTFTSLTNSSNLTAELDTTAGLTALIPTDAAFANANVSSTNPTTPSLMDGHIIPNFVGYLPALTNGLKLITQAGTTVTVTVQGNDFYLNNAKIIASNLILENGVAHVLDQVRRLFHFRDS